MPMSMYFKADVKMALVIGCADYSMLREIEGRENFADLEDAMEDVKVAKAGLKRLGFTKILVLKDPEYMKVSMTIMDIKREIWNNYNAGLGTLLWVYYAGHGMMDNTTSIILNGPKTYPLERMLRGLAMAEGSYVIAVFDCCRERMQALQMRGGNGPESPLEIEEDDCAYDLNGAPAGSQENLIMSFGCKPSAGVPAKSTLARTYFRYIRKSAR